MKILNSTPRYNAASTSNNYQNAPLKQQMGNDTVHFTGLGSKIAKGTSDAYNTMKTKNQMFNEELSDGIVKVLKPIISSKPSEKIIEKFAKFKHPSARMSDLVSIALTAFYVQNTAKSKKIEKERKMPLILNTVAVTIASSVMAAITDAATDKYLERATKAFVELKESNALPETIFKGAKDFDKACSKAKSLFVFTTIVRFLVPVLMIPISGNIVSYIKKKSKEKQDLAQSENPQQQESKMLAKKPSSKLGTTQG